MNSFRSEFPQLKRLTYLNTAADGLLPLRTIEACRRLIGRFKVSVPRDTYTRNVIGKLKNELAKLFNVPPHCFALTLSTTTGLKLALSLIDVKKGENIVSFDLEFPGVAWVVKSKCRQAGCTLRVVKHRNGRYDYGEIEKAVDDKTKAIVLSSVEWVNGFKFDLKKMSEIASSVNAYLIVDAVQHAGALRLDLSRVKVDILVSSSNKWLITPKVGCGFTYINPEILDELKEPLYGLHNMEEPRGGWEKWWAKPDKDVWSYFKPIREASRYEWGGTPPLLNIYATYTSISMINEAGIERIESINMNLKRYLIDELRNLGVERIYLIDEPSSWSSITLFNVSGKIERDMRIAYELRKRGVRLSYRGTAGIGGIRVSPHFYNSRDDIDRLIFHLRELMKNL